MWKYRTWKNSFWKYEKKFLEIPCNAKFLNFVLRNVSWYVYDNMRYRTILLINVYVINTLKRFERKIMGFLVIYLYNARVHFYAGRYWNFLSSILFCILTKNSFRFSFRVIAKRICSNTIFLVLCPSLKLIFYYWKIFSILL